MKYPTEKLGEVAQITMGTSPTGNFYTEEEIGLPLLNGPTEFGSVFPHCTLYTTKSIRECLPNDLIFCVRGSTTGRMNWADKVYSLGRGVCSIRGQNFLESKFIRFCLELKLNELLLFAGGSTFPNLTQDAMREFRIPFPQNRLRIAEILSAYDDLIENNLKRIRLLEESARLLYREWFVRLKFPNHEHTPLIDGLPEDWANASVGSLGEVITGKTPSTADENNYGDEFPFVKTPDMHGNIFVVKTESSLSEQGANTQRNKYLPKGAIMVSCIGTVGVVSLASTICQTNQQINSVIPKLKEYQFYSFFALQDLKPIMEAIGGGATMNNVNKSKFESLDVLLPSESMLKNFDEIVNPMFEQILNLLTQNQKLKQARDLLLPRLMSGEIAI